MTPRTFLREIRDVTPADVADAVATLDAQRDALAARAETPAVSAALGHLAQKRLVASNTLRNASTADRLAWDEANRWVNERLVREAGPWTTSELVALNRRLGGTEFRRGPMFTGNDEYLAPEEVGPELDALCHWLATRGDVVASAVTYVALVTIHPFDNANGRTARLAADAMFLGEGYLPLCFLSSIASHVAQTLRGPEREPRHVIRRTLAAVAESYATVLRRINE